MPLSPATPLDRALLALIVIAAAGLRLAWHAVAADVDWPDTAVYIETGRALVETGQMSSTRYMPLYPILITWLGPAGILYFQILVSTITVLIVYALSVRIFDSRPAGLFAALMAAGYPLLIFYANMRLSETVFTALFLSGLLAWYRDRVVLGAVLITLSILVRPAIDLIAPLLLVACCLAQPDRPSLAGIARRVAVYFAIYVALMAPWWVHNYQKYGAFVRLNLGDGIVMLLENNTLFERVGLDFAALAPMEIAFDAVADPVERNEAMKRAAFDYILAHPAQYLERVIDRMARFWSPVPGSQKPLVNVLAFAATLPFYIGAAVALVLFWQRWRTFLPILVAIGFLFAVHTATHALPRYRLPLDPLLMVLASGWFAVVGQTVWARFGRHL